MGYSGRDHAENGEARNHAEIKHRMTRRLNGWETS